MAISLRVYPIFRHTHFDKRYKSFSAQRSHISFPRTKSQVLHADPAVYIYCSSFLALREFVGQLVIVSRAHYKTCLFFEPMGKDKDHNKWLAQYFSPSNFPHIYHQKVWIRCTKLWDVGVMPRQAVHSKLYHSAGFSCITMGPRPASMRMIFDMFKYSKYM